MIHIHDLIAIFGSTHVADSNIFFSKKLDYIFMFGPLPEKEKRRIGVGKKSITRDLDCIPACSGQNTAAICGNPSSHIFLPKQKHEATATAKKEKHL